jgi:NodT family efflux transporter outer membrane factor (OMF) lipoprotein
MNCLKERNEKMKTRNALPWLILSIGALMMTGGCAVGPNYFAPKTQLLDRWQQDPKYGLNCEAGAPEYWRELNDPVLTTLIERASENNKDLKIAWWNLQQARAQIGVIKGEFFPSVDADGSYTRSRASKYGPAAPPPVTDPNTGRVTYPNPEAQDLTRIGGVAAWEIDVFGRIRRSYESVLASEQASLENYHDVMVILKADVATSYIEVRTLQKRLMITAANIDSQKKTLALARARYESGLVPALDVSQARSNLSATEANVPTLRAALRRAINRLDVLLGEQPGTVAAGLIGEGILPKLPADVAMGLPCDLVRRRPDIRRAERDLAAQTARIGVATSELYPFFTLTGALHFEATNIDDIGRAFSGAYSFGPQFTWNIFDGNRIRSRIKVEEAVTEGAIVVYERTVLLAIREVEDAANDYVREIERKEKLAESVQALEDSVRLVEEQYRSGLTDFQNVLDMQRSLFVQQDNLAVSEGLSLQNLIRIFRASGGGWEKELPAATQPVCVEVKEVECSKG